jgi:hypothetical protein
MNYFQEDGPRVMVGDLVKVVDAHSGSFGKIGRIQRISHGLLMVGDGCFVDKANFTGKWCLWCGIDGLQPWTAQCEKANMKPGEEAEMLPERRVFIAENGVCLTSLDSSVFHVREFLKAHPDLGPASIEIESILDVAAALIDSSCVNGLSQEGSR